MSFLQIRDVHKSYGDNEVLRGVSLEVARHEVVCLIGASGSGKSTLLRCINALEPIDSGDICVDGDVVTGLGVDVNRLRRNVGIVFQSLQPVSAHVRPAQRDARPDPGRGPDRRAAEERAIELLARVGMADKANAYPDSLSGGQQQRVAIVRAMAMHRG